VKNQDEAYPHIGAGLLSSKFYKKYYGALHLKNENKLNPTTNGHDLRE
jgi:hypothetical protein